MHQVTSRHTSRTFQRGNNARSHNRLHHWSPTLSHSHSLSLSFVTHSLALSHAHLFLSPPPTFRPSAPHPSAPRASPLPQRVVSFPRVKDRAGAPLGAQVSFSINTGDELVTNLTVSPDGQWLACGSVQHCKLLDLRAGTGTLTERTVHSFQTDFAEPSPGQNVVRFQGSDALFTGGDDGQLRYWSIDSGAEGGGAKGGGAMASVTLAAATQGEEGHRKPIGSIAIHGSAGLVATASKDGTCCVWQFAPAGKRGFRGSIKKAKGKSAKKAFLRKEQTLTLRAKGATDCRACVWSPVDGEHLFVLENCSARRKRQAAYITVYGHGKGGNVDTALEMGVFSLAPRNTQQVGNNPCTAMSICPNGRLLGLGDNGGMVSWKWGSGEVGEWRFRFGEREVVGGRVGRWGVAEIGWGKVLQMRVRISGS